MLKRILSTLDIPGGSILGLFSLCAIALSCYAVVAGKPFPSEIRDIYIAVVTAFAATNVAKHYKGLSNDTEK